jgi:endonuclease/exonuclease/phosphatase (EEP) superfamily protein YafD
VRDPVRIIIIWTLAALVAGLTVLSFGDRLGLDGRPGWVFDLLSHWPRHLALAGLVVAGIAFWRRAHAAGVTALVAASINLALLIGVGGFASPQPAPDDARLIRIVSANVHGSMEALVRIASLSRDYDADLVAIYEAPDSLTTNDVGGLFPGLPVNVLPSQRANGWPLIRRSFVAARGAGVGGVAMFEGSHGVLIHGVLGPVQFVTTHPPSPGDPGLMQDRNQQLRAAAGFVHTSRPFIIAGDFNSTPWGRAYAFVPGARAGDPRFEGTFPAILGPFGLPIDHIRFGGGLVLTDYRAGPDIGSDHLPLFATFALPKE